MKKIKIKYVPKSKLYPAFGLADFKKQIAYIRKDLPRIVQKYLVEHETFHLKDWNRLQKKKKKECGFWAEIKANIYGFLKQPVGALITLLMSLTPARLKLYFDRITKGY